MPCKAIFLDRDNTLIHDPGYINHPSQVKMIDGAGEALVELRKMGYKLIVVSNQSAVARGIVTEKVLGEIHEQLKKLLLKKKAYLDAIYYCPYHIEGVIEKYRKHSNCRKPNPGMLLKAAEEFNIDLDSSWMIGDTYSDIEAGKKAGCQTILLSSQPDAYIKNPNNLKADHKAVNMKESVNIIKQHERNSEIDQLHPNTELKKTTSVKPEKTAEELPKEITEPTTETTTNEILVEILEQMKFNQRSNLFNEFSVMRMFSGIAQISAVACFGLAIYYLIGSTKNIENVFLSLNFAIFLQLIALTFYIMHDRK